MKQNNRTFKSVLALLLLASMTLGATACKDSTTDTPEAIATAATTTTAVTEVQIPEPLADPIEALKSQPEVVSLKQYEGQLPIDTVGYELTFTSGELKIAAELILPADFKTGGTSLIFYYPEVGLSMNETAAMFVSNRVGIVRLYARGYGNSEGMRDMGGEDIADALTLFALCEKAGLTANRRLYAAGSSEGSITALRMAEEVGDKLSGVAVIDLISDLEKFCEARGEGVTSLTESLVGGTAADLPDEYKRRSAVYFADKIGCPVLLAEYKDHPLCPVEQVDLLEDALVQANKPCERYTIDALGSDFIGEAGQKLLSWIASHA